MEIIGKQDRSSVCFVHSRRGSAMIIIICAAALFSALSLSLLFSSATLAAAANRKILRMQTYEQALSFSEAFTNQLSSANYDPALSQSIDNFLTESSNQELSTYTFPFPVKSVLPDGYGEIELILRKQQQKPYTNLLEATFNVDDYLLKDKLFYYEKTLKDIDYLVWVSVRCTINGDEGSASTVDSKFKCTVNYVPTYSLVRGGITTVIHHDNDFIWYSDSGTMISPQAQAGDVIKAACAEEGGLYYYQIPGVD